MLGQRRRRWADIVPTLVERFVLAGRDRIKHGTMSNVVSMLGQCHRRRTTINQRCVNVIASETTPKADTMLF